jgi:ribosomal protein S18 acetylase RimI-like enzyme
VTSGSRVVLQPAGPEDDDFVRGLFIADRAARLAGIPLNGPQLAQLLEMQWTARNRDYNDRYPSLQTFLIIHAAEAIGAMAVSEAAPAAALVDIILAEGRRNQGFGSDAIEAWIAGLPIEVRTIRLTVEQTNPAKRLYERIGFRPVASDPMSVAMELDRQ